MFLALPPRMSARELVAMLERDFREIEGLALMEREISNEQCIPISLRRQAHVHGRRYKKTGMARSAA